MPSRSVMICRNVVAWPWPWSWVPTDTVDGAGGVEADFRVLDQAGIGGLDGGGHADAAQLPRFSELAAARRKAGIIGEREAVLEILAEIAAVIGVDQRGAVRHGARPEIMLRRRSSAGSIRSSRAARSTMVSTT